MNVATSKPPITVIPNGDHISDPIPVLVAIGSMPRIVVNAVIKTGRKRE